LALADVVKYDGPRDVFAWKYPNAELGTRSQLIVNEAQEAVFFKDGKALDVFPSGRYTLNTENLPLLRDAIRVPLGGRTPFAAEVWFVNRLYVLDIKWGTPAPVTLRDPEFGVIVPMRAYGQLGLRVLDSKTFLTRLVGTVDFLDKETLNDFFRGVYLTHIRDTISSYVMHRRIGVLEITAFLLEISAYMKEALSPVFQEYGIELLNFYVNNIDFPEDDLSVKKLRNALAVRAEMDIVGYDYAQQRSLDVLEGAAKNTGAGVGVLTQIGAGVGLAAAVGGMVRNELGGAPDAGARTSPPQPAKSARFCPACGVALASPSRFCPDCGAKLPGEA
jgi:membrane protease subunit (stomatin/prohibitin family)